ncbi:MAG: hypothetical protein ACTSU4_05270 [Promethearchaeota archaeon]
MRPPICAVCGERFDPAGKGGLVYFVMRKSDEEWRKRMKKIHSVGHPPWAEWFCAKHYPIAVKYNTLTIDEAWKRMREDLKIT